MNLRDLDISDPIQGRVASSRRLSTAAAPVEVRHIELTVPPGIPRVLAGQSVAVLVPTADAHPHVRLYTVAGVKGELPGSLQLALCVRRSFGVDRHTGERVPGVASNYLCDLCVGDEVALAGPFGGPFRIPNSVEHNVLMIGAGTGMAPFRAFIQRLYIHAGGWRGRVHLFYGAESGLECLYLNELEEDLSQYLQQETFRAYEAIRDRGPEDSTRALQLTLQDNAAEVWELVREPGTHVYLCGLRPAEAVLDELLSWLAGSYAAWATRKNRMLAEGRWQEILYD